MVASNATYITVASNATYIMLPVSLCNVGSQTYIILQPQVLALAWALAQAQVQAQTHTAPLEQGAQEPLELAVAMTLSATRVLH